MNLPRYDELPIRPDLPPRSAWGVWGDDDQLGSINLLTPERALRATGLVARGEVFSLNWALEEPFPPFYERGALQHHIKELFPNIMDDSVDGLFTQASSQWDALCHVGHPEYGYWNGTTESDFHGREGTLNGIEHWARKGIVGRGVLLDVARHFEATGHPIDGSVTVEFTPQDLEEVREAQRVEFEVGDILILRTGWMNWYENASSDVKDGLAADSINRLTTPGLIGSEGMAEWLWNHHFAALAADNTAVEAWPHKLEVDSYLHFRLIPLLGLALGEMWSVEELAADCAVDGRYDFMLTSAPLNLRGGVGSPPNVLAIK
jgi:kynurenine formamidase